VFRTVVEWQSPDFQRRGGMIALAFLVIAVIVLFRQHTAWRDALPVAVFIGLGLFAMRNLAPMAIVVAPAMGRAFAGGAPAGRRPINALIAGVMALAFVVIGASAAAGAGLDTSSYPVAATTWLDRHGYFAAPHRVAEQDVVGCYLDLRDGPHGNAFIDDRVDMFPVRVSEDYRALLRAAPAPVGVLDRWHVDAVLWQDNQPLTSLLKLAPGWRLTYHHAGWSVFTRTA